MIESSAAYLAAITGDTRRVLLKAVIHIIDPDMQLTGGSADSLAPWAKTAELYDYRFTTARYATLEQDRWLLDGSFDIFPDDYQVSEHMGVADAQLSGADGSFASPAWAAITFSDVSVLQAFSVYFPTDELEGVAEDFTVEVLSAGQTFFTKTVTGNTVSAVAFEGFTVQTPDTIRVTVTKWSLFSRRMRVVEILPGVYEEWTEDIVAAFDCKQQGDVSCLSLPYGTCTLKMDNLSRRFEPRSKSGLFQSIEERQGVETYIGVRLADSTVEYKRVGVFYQYSDGWKTGDNGLTMQWDLVDIIGLLADRAFLAPTVLPITLSGWIASLVAQLGTNFADRYTVDADYADLAVGLEPRRGEREEVRRHPALGLHGDRHMAARGRGDRQTCGGAAVEPGQQDHAGKPCQLPDHEGQPVPCVAHFPPLGRDGVRRLGQLHEQREDRDHREPVSAHAGAGAHGGAADPLVLRRQPAGADRARRSCE